MEWLDGVRALIQLCKDEERNPCSRLNDEQRTDLVFIDRVWMEQAIFEIEDEDERVLPDGVAHIVDRHQMNDRCYGVVVIGNVDTVAGMMDTRPFPQKTRRPRGGEIYHMKKTTEVGGKAAVWERRFLGTYTARDV